MPILEAGVKFAALGLSAVTGGAMLAVVEGVTESKGIEGHLTLATGAVGCVITLFAALKWAVGKLLQAKDEQITALRERERKERERADQAEAALREALREQIPSEPDNRQSRR
jgi:hypothetical protein